MDAKRNHNLMFADTNEFTFLRCRLIKIELLVRVMHLNLFCFNVSKLEKKFYQYFCPVVQKHTNFEAWLPSKTY